MVTMRLKKTLREVSSTIKAITPFGWFIIFTLFLVPLMLGWAWGNEMNGELIWLQSKTNGMEHTTNWQQLHKTDLLNIKKRGNRK